MFDRDNFSVLILWLIRQVGPKSRSEVKAEVEHLFLAVDNVYLQSD